MPFNRNHGRTTSSILFAGKKDKQESKKIEDP